MDPLIRISELFAQTVLSQYKEVRYGIKTCSKITDEELAEDLRILLIRKREQVICGCSSLRNSCSLSKIEEKINTL